MKRILFTLNLCLFAIIMMAQVPAGFSYQAVVRNTSGDIVANKSVKFKFSILRNSETGTNVYVETQSVTTNAFGLANLKVGLGTKVSGTFDPAAWGNNKHFLKVELDPNNGNSFSHLGTTQLLAVPYAFHSQTVEDDSWGTQTAVTNSTLEGNGTTSSPLKIAQQSAINGQVLKWNGTSWTPNSDESGEGGSSPFTSSGGITSNSPITDNFVVGSSSLDDVSGTNDDARMFFSKTKSAFRVGKADANQWDDSNVGINSIAFGSGTIASGDFSIAMGLRTKASGGWSMAMGYNSEASGSYSFATGQSTASENYCTAMGIFTEASGRVSTALGAYTIAPSGYETAIGRYNTKYTIDKKLGWGQTDRLFVIGNGVADNQRSNALVMLKNGNTGFGVDNPAYKLEINGQIKIMGGNPGSGKVLTSDANGLASWQTPSSGNTGWTVLENNVYTSVTGNVGIGTTNPSHKLDVLGDRIRLFDESGDWIAMRTDGTILDFTYSGGNIAFQGSTNGEDILLNPSRISKVGIRTWNPAYTLDVTGDIRATGSVFYGGNPGSSDGTLYSKPDFVFKDNYYSLNTEQIEEFIKKENHLPWVTSAKKEKEENGNVIDMTRMAFETLETVENLQLQVIEQNKLIKELKAENDRLKAENEKISARLEKIESILNLNAQK